MIYEHHIIIISCALCMLMGIVFIYLLLLFDSNARCFDNQLVSWSFVIITKGKEIKNIHSKFNSSKTLTGLLVQDGFDNNNIVLTIFIHNCRFQPYPIVLCIFGNGVSLEKRLCFYCYSIFSCVRHLHNNNMFLFD